MLTERYRVAQPHTNVQTNRSKHSSRQQEHKDTENFLEWMESLSIDQTIPDLQIENRGRNMVALAREHEQPAPAEEESGNNEKLQPSQGFAGIKKSKGYTAFNNAMLDAMLAEIDNIAEYKVVQYVYRHTEGYHQQEVHITVGEFMTGRLNRSGEPLDRGTQLSERSVQNGIKKALEDGFIERRQEGNRVYFSLKAPEQEAQTPEADEEAASSDQSAASQERGQAPTVTSGQPSQERDQSQRAQSLHPSTDRQGAQSLHPKGAKVAPRTGKSCTPAAQSLHPSSRTNPHQNSRERTPKEKITERKTTEREKEKGVSLSPSSISSNASGGHEGQTDGHNPQLENTPTNAERVKNNLARYAALVAQQKQRKERVA